MKRILTVQDISCIGKCSLSVALPIISAMGIECAVLPTAVLSTHTAFSGFTFRDLTQDIPSISAHWQKLGMTFDALYTGYIASIGQLRLVRELLLQYGTQSNLIIVDPVMADNGRMYAGFTPEFAMAMAGLCAHADIIMPNLTEACLLLGLPYPGDTYSEDFIRGALIRLAELGCKTVILKGIATRAEELGVMSYTAESGTFTSYFHRRLPGKFHGTGDIFASCVAGAQTEGLSIEESVRLAADFTLDCIEATIADTRSNWYGVQFESALPQLIRRYARR